MATWAFYPVFLGAFLSFFGWMYLIVRKHDRTRPRTLSELAADEQVLGYFRVVLWICGSLFAITIFLFIWPQLHYELPVVIFGAGMIACELLLGVFPARGRYDTLHNILSQLMGLMMGLLALAFALELTSGYRGMEIGLTTAIVGFGLAAVLDRRRFIYYEMPFIFLSHISILIAAVAVHAR